MNHTEVLDMINKAEIIFKSEFPDFDISIRWDLTWQSRRTYGQCSYEGSRRCLIKLSQFHWLNSQRAGVWNTICHELCHAYNTHHDGHGRYWKAIAMKMSRICHTDIKRVGGASESKCNMGSLDGAQPVAKFHCPCCNRDFFIFRRGRAYQNNGVGYTCGCCHTLLDFTKLR